MFVQLSFSDYDEIIYYIMYDLLLCVSKIMSLHIGIIYIYTPTSYCDENNFSSIQQSIFHHLRTVPKNPYDGAKYLWSQHVFYT